MEDPKKQEDAGKTVTSVRVTLDDTDGCSGQCRCGSALFLLWKFAFEHNIDYDRAVDCAGHDKKRVDGYGGWLKITYGGRCVATLSPSRKTSVRKVRP